jgi:AcrR family transcriptional regulator
MPRSVALSKSQSPVRERIVAGARPLFFNNGFRSVTMDDVAAALGMSKKTLYSHFPGKRDLIEAVLHHKMADVDLAMKSAVSPDHFPDQLAGLLACIQAGSAEIQPAFMRDLQKEEPSLFEIVRSARTSMIQNHFGKLIRMGQASGHLRRDLRVELVIDMLIGAVNAVAYPQKLMELDMTPRQALTAVLSVFLDGIGRTKTKSPR